MKDTEIIKALEYCISDNDNICTGCAALKNGIDCALEYSIILDLINRQERMIKCLNAEFNSIKSGADLLKADNVRLERIRAKLSKETENLKIELQTMRGVANGFKAEVERLQKAECSFAEAGGKLVVQYKQAKEQICRLQADKDTLIRNYANCQKELLKEFAEQVKTAFYAEFDELIPSIMADKIDDIYKEMVGEKCNETD